MAAGVVNSFRIYRQSTRTLILNSGETQKTFEVQVLDRALEDGDRQLGIQPSNAQGGATITPGGEVFKWTNPDIDAGYWRDAGNGLQTVTFYDPAPASSNRKFSRLAFKPIP